MSFNEKQWNVCSRITPFQEDYYWGTDMVAIRLTKEHQPCSHAVTWCESWWPRDMGERWKSRSNRKSQLALRYSWTYWRGWGWILHRSLTERKRSVFSQINPSNRCPNRKIKLLFNLLVCEGWDFAISKPRKDVYPGQQQDTQEFVSRGPEQKEDDVDLFLRWIFHFYSTFLKDIHSS